MNNCFRHIPDDAPLSVIDDILSVYKHFDTVFDTFEVINKSDQNEQLTHRDGKSSKCAIQ